MSQALENQTEKKGDFLGSENPAMSLITHQERLKVQDSIQIKCLVVFSLRGGRQVVRENLEMDLPSNMKWPRDAYICTREIKVETCVGSVSKVFGPAFVIGTVIDEKQAKCVKSQHIDLAAHGHKFVLCYDGTTRGMSSATVVLSPEEVNFEK